MSVPKRFKTKVQRTNQRTSVKVLVKSNPIYLLDKYLIFVHPSRTKQINKQKLSYSIKK